AERDDHPWAASRCIVSGGPSHLHAHNLHQLVVHKYLFVGMAHGDASKLTVQQVRGRHWPLCVNYRSPLSAAQAAVSGRKARRSASTRPESLRVQPADLSELGTRRLGSGADV